MRSLLIAFATATICGCIGTMDSVHFVEGKAPKDQSCEVQVLKGRTSEVIASQSVHGPFSFSFTAGGLSAAPVDVVALCKGSKVKELVGLNPRVIGNIALGKLAP